MKSLFKRITLQQISKNCLKQFNQEITSLIKFNFGAKTKATATKNTKAVNTKAQSPKKVVTKASPKKEVKIAKNKKVAYVEPEDIDVELEEEVVTPKKIKKRLAAPVEEAEEVEVPKKSKKAKKAPVEQEEEYEDEVPVQKSTKKAKKQVVKQEVEEEEEAVEEVPVKTKKVGVKAAPEKRVPQKKDIWEINVYTNAYELGRIPLNAQTNPIITHGFPFANSTSTDPYEAYINSQRTTQLTKTIINQERLHLCQNYSPLPVVVQRANGAIIQDVDGFKYIDALTGYGSVNFGHSNENILKTMTLQASKLQMTSRALYNDVQYRAAELACKIFGKEKCIFMNSGVEAGETAVKFARRWGYRVKNIPDNKASMVFMKGNFWGRTIHACGTSDDPSRYKDFGPFVTSDHLVEYNNVEALSEVLKSDPNICAVMLEPIQGEAGFIIPSEDYLLKVRKLCNDHKVLMICDEVQSGMGRTGRLLASQWSLDLNNSPDLIILAKSLSNGFYPVSCVLGNANIIDLIKPGEHGSTFSGNPIAMSIAIQAMTELIKNEYEVVRNAGYVGGILSGLIASRKFKFVKEVRGRGLMIGVEFQKNIPIKASDICLLLLERGLVTKPTHENNIRIAPPLNSNKNLILSIFEIINFVLSGLEVNYPSYVPQEEQTHNIFITEQTNAEINNYANLRNQGKLNLNYSKENPLHKKYSELIGSHNLVKNIDLTSSSFGQIASSSSISTGFPDLSQLSSVNVNVSTNPVQSNNTPTGFPTSLLTQNSGSQNPAQNQKIYSTIDQINSKAKH